MLIKNKKFFYLNIWSTGPSCFILLMTEMREILYIRVNNMFDSHIQYTNYKNTRKSKKFTFFVTSW